MPRQAVLLCLLVVASCASSSVAQEASVSLKDQGGRVHLLQGGFFTEAPKEVVWRVLSDYDSISRFSSLVRSSRIREHRDGSFLVEQEAFPSFFIFSKRIYMLLKVTEKPPDTIYFEEVSGKDFDFYSGSWHIDEVPGGCWVLYSLKVRQKFTSIPDVIAKRVFKRNARRFLMEVLAETERRNVHVGQRP